MQRWQSAVAIGRLPYRTKDALTTSEAFSQSIRCLHSSSQHRADEGNRPSGAQREIKRSAMQELSQMPRTQTREVTRRIRSDAPSPRGGAPGMNNAPRELIRRFNPNGRGGRGSGGGGLRGNFRGRGLGGGGMRGRGRGRGRGGNRRGGRAATDAPEDEDREVSVEEGFLDDDAHHSIAEYMGEHYESHFSSDAEHAAYHDFAQTLEHIETEWSAANAALEAAQLAGDAPGIASAASWWDYIDARLRDALKELRAVDDTAFPPHVPAAIDTRAFYAEHGIGNIPTGTGGLGNVAEDALRHLANREGMGWRDPAELARRVGAGEFVAFQSKMERRAVMLRVWTLPDTRGERGADGKIAHTHFGGLASDADARRELLRRVLQGNITDPQDAELGSEAEREAARLTAGRYGAHAKHTLLQTIREHLPKPKAAA